MSRQCVQGLDTCADTMIGSATAGIKGISGGEKRRCSVGIELVTSPQCLFLDEPTSGLDSEVALAIMRTLRRITSVGRTVVLTIHQPNSDITELFDDFILMAKARIMYAGAPPPLPCVYCFLCFRCLPSEPLNHRGVSSVGAQHCRNFCKMPPTITGFSGLACGDYAQQTADCVKHA
jgi:energy-coupling factor transporter ATP-binding protein EcfA2